MTDKTQDEDTELDPKILKFGMSKAEVDKLKSQAKERKKMNKGWKPSGH
jgi:hypothetical protein